MDKERVKQELKEKYPGVVYEPAINIAVDAVELMIQDDMIVHHYGGSSKEPIMTEVVTGSLVVCPECNGVGHINVSGLDTYCLMCKGYGSVKAESNTPSA